MSNDRLGVRWGLAGGTMLSSVDQARSAARFAESAGFDSLWISHSMAVDPIVALACVADDAPSLSELGTSVVPLYGRHPIGLAQLAMTAQTALAGRFTLGIGAASKEHAEDRLGLSWAKPFTFTRQFVDALEPLLAGRQTDMDASELCAHAQLLIDAPPTPILLAALGPRMLRFAGARLAGTSLGQCGPKTIASYVLPTLREGAESAGRTLPRIMALVRISVTDDHAGALALAREISARYQAIPSYARVLAREGLDDPARLHLIGSWQQVLDGLAAYAEAGVTDLRIEVATHSPAAREATQAALADYLSG
ncbi:MAG: TIGR03564 family F420-dependent LLM class oxidoreductase [Gammaproteobacteria bacterium]|nr:TIGR03564 family F420-dependent LLM class oxidoreductase [Gammaproteobacteria bacterium]